MDRAVDSVAPERTMLRWSVDLEARLNLATGSAEPGSVSLSLLSR